MFHAVPIIVAISCPPPSQQPASSLVTRQSRRAVPLALLGRSVPRNAPKSERFSTASALPTLHRARSTPRCWMKAATFVRGQPCIASCARHTKCADGAIKARQGSYSKPELLATQPKQLWSWDITKLKGATTWTYHYLYVIMDVFSRYVVGWMIAERETAELAEAFIAETCAKEGIVPGTLTLHADRGSAMTSKCVAHLLADLGVVKTHSRPQVSNDNPFSEAQFKTVKYHPSCPERFGSVEDARAWARELFEWYNHEHHHTGIGLLTPAVVHTGQASEVVAKREEVMAAAYVAHPERFVRGRPRVPQVPQAVWINPPAVQTVERSAVAAIESDPTIQVGASGRAGSRGTSVAALEAALPLAMLRAARFVSAADPGIAP